MVSQVGRAAPSAGDDAPSFDELYDSMWWPMLRLAAGLVDDRAAAEDVVQDAFAALYRRWDALRTPAAGSATCARASSTRRVRRCAAG